MKTKLDYVHTSFPLHFLWYLFLKSGMGARNCTRVAKLSDYMKSDDISKIYVYTAAAARISNLYSYKSGNYTIHDTPLGE